MWYDRGVMTGCDGCGMTGVDGCHVDRIGVTWNNRCVDGVTGVVSTVT